MASSRFYRSIFMDQAEDSKSVDGASDRFTSVPFLPSFSKNRWKPLEQVKMIDMSWMSVYDLLPKS
jgi:hypothetical protein